MTLTIAYLAGMALLFLFLRNKEISLPLPNLLTVLGVLGTFIGIFWGLLKFDVEDIQGSVPKLLDGLRFAFLTSIAGMGSAVALRVWPAVKGAQGVKVRGATIDTLASLLQQVIKVQTETAEKNTEQLGQIKSALTGERLPEPPSGTPWGALT